MLYYVGLHLFDLQYFTTFAANVMFTDMLYITPQTNMAVRPEKVDK